MATAPGTKATRALDDLYRSHAGAVYRYAYAVLGNRADAEDVTQTTFVNALRALERGERPRTPENWLLVIAHNIVRQRIRQQRSRPAEVRLHAGIVDPAEPGDERSSVEELVRALQRIPASQREALVMRELEGRSYKEIAGILGLTTGALETLLFRARRSLAEELESIATCEQAEHAISRQADGRLSRKDRRRLDEHLAGCDACARAALRQRRQRRHFKGLAVLPLPLSLTFFRGTPDNAAAAALPTIGAGAAVTGSAGGGGVVGGLLGGVAVKAATVVAAAAVVGGTGYEAVQQVGGGNEPPAVTTPRGALPSTPRPRPPTVQLVETARPAVRPHRAEATATRPSGSRLVRERPAGSTRISPEQAKKEAGSASADPSRRRPLHAKGHAVAPGPARAEVKNAGKAKQPKGDKAAEPVHAKAAATRAEPKPGARPKATQNHASATPKSASSPADAAIATPPGRAKPPKTTQEQGAASEPAPPVSDTSGPVEPPPAEVPPAAADGHGPPAHAQAHGTK
jgi:RNA polymerase sigma factor (sigma-70 family)